MFRRLLLFWLAPLLLILSACGSQNDASSGPTPTPLPTTTAPEFPVVASRACQVARFAALRTRQPQGDLIAWTPSGDQLAFVGPDANSNWFSGKLKLVSGPSFSSPIDLAPDLLTFGDLTWSPDGSQLAYVVFRQPDTYSVYVSPPTNGAPLDLFAALNPHTDSWVGSKAIESWRSNNVLRVLSSCGEDCDQTFEIDLSTNLATPVGDPIRKAKNRLYPHPNERDYDSAVFPVMFQDSWSNTLSPQMKRPTWSQDGSKVAYIDKTITAWVLDTLRKEQYILDTPFVDVQELKWAPEGRYLALRTDDDVYVFDTDCAQK